MNLSIQWILQSAVVWALLLSMINSILVTPIIFNYYIIPRIEKKINKKLEYHPWFEFFFLETFF